MLPNSVIVPGRANVMGEHTDYNGGLSLPLALDLAVTVTVAPLDSEVVVVRADGFGVWSSLEAPREHWQRQAAEIVSRSPRRGCLLTVTSNLPVGAGLSSSAAFLGALHLALGGDGDLVQTAHVLAQAEAASGTPVGLLDQLATLGANAQSALLIDFANLTLRDVPISDVVGLSIVHTETERELATSAYVERRAQCATLDSLLGEWSRRPDAWRDVDDDLLRRRARHVCTDNTRVERAADALTRGDLVGLGVLLNESHESLRDDFEVSTPEVDEVWRSVNLLPGVAGSRLMGGGFGGCLLVAHEPELDLALAHHRTWPVRASAGAFARLGRPR